MDDDDYQGGRPMSNEDFRRLLATPRPGAGKKEEHGEKKKRPKPAKPHKPKPGGEQGAEEPGYRDRAAERRKGITTDFDAIPEDLAGILAGGQEGSLAKLSYEESKFLGGDIAHTHLVKGLDFALLQKIRAEEAARKGAAGEEEEEEEEEKPAAAVQQQHQETKFSTPLGRAVHAFFFDPKQRRSRADVAQMFLPRRTAFVYELDEPHAPDVPTMLRRSKEDCPKVQETLLGAVDSSMLERMAKIMSYMSLAGGKKKMKKKDKIQLLQGIQGAKHAGVTATPANGSAAVPRHEVGGSGSGVQAPGGPTAPAALAAAEQEEDDDIFADAGTDYVVERRKGAEGTAGTAGGAAGRYFDRQEDMSDLPPLPAEEGPAPPPPPPPPTGNDDDMELEQLVAPPPPPLDAEAGPARPPAGADYSSAYPEADAYGAYPDTDAAYAAAAAAQPAAAPSRQPERAKKDDAGQRRRAAAAEAEDAYAECYPSYYEYAGTVMDSDDEEGAGGARGSPEAGGAGLSRSDFNSEEEYREYLAANPGRGGETGKGDTRRAKRDASKRDNKQQQKLSSQLDKIQRIMEDKGFDHADAFRKGGGGKGGGGGGGGMGGAGGGLGEPAVPTKRRRI